MAQPAAKYYTEQEYLQFEREAEEKHEYYKGEIFMMSGASYAHNIIEDNLRGELYRFLKDKKCRSLGSNMRVKVEAHKLFTYPDALIVCDEPQFADNELDTLLNPSVLFEILSPSTANYDKGSKFEMYRSIPTLREYILIDSRKIGVEHYRRNDDNSWTLHEYKNPQDRFVIHTITMELITGDLYDSTQL